MRRAAPALFLVAALAASFAHSPARAQGTARSMDIDPSVRSWGMGGASVAVFWDQDLNHWSNPALLGGLRGIRWEQGHTQLVPDLASDVEFTSQVLKAGGGGLGVVWSGTAPGPGGVHLDYGTSIVTDPSGNYGGTFNPFEQVNSWGFGVSLLEAIGGFRHASQPRDWSRYGDVSFGMNFKHADVALAPGLLEGSTNAHDWGVLVRATPINHLFVPDALPIRVDLSWAYSALSANDDAVIDFGAAGSSRVSRHRRDGFAGHVAFTPTSVRSQARKNVWLRGLTPLVSVGGAYEKATVDAGDGTSGYRTTGYGGELEVANVLAFRFGHYADKTGDIDGITHGWTVGLPIGPWAGVRYSTAKFPEADGLSDVERHGWQVWINPFEVGHLLNDDD